VEHYLEAHHSPDVFHVQHELVKAVSGPMATKERAAHQAVTEAREQLERLQTAPESAGDEPEKRRPGHFPKHPGRLEHAEQALEAASREHERLAQHREQVKARMRGIGHDSHGVDLERGVRRNGQRIASAIQGHIEQMRTMARHEGLSQRCLERMHLTPCGRTVLADRRDDVITPGTAQDNKRIHRDLLGFRLQAA
jgi:hypothetical protein